MKTKFATAVALLVVLSFLWGSAAQPTKADSPPVKLGAWKKVMLANNGQAKYTIYIASEADAMERGAAEELASYLEDVTGAPFQLSSTVPSGRAIVVGRGAWTDTLIPDLEQQQLGEDGFVIRDVGQQLVITGSHSRGTMYGVNYFLDEYVGVKWYAPQYTYVPSIGKLKVCVGNDVQIPRFAYREMFVHDGNDERFRARNLLNGKYRDRYITMPQSVPELDNWSDYWPYDVHTFYKLVPDTQYHSGGQLLAMSEDVRSMAANQLIATITDRAAAGKDPSYSFSQQDGGWTPDAQSRSFADLHGGTLAAPIFDMVGDVANRVRQQLPDARIGTLAYAITYTPPTGMTVPDNVVITVAPSEKDHGQPINSVKNQRFGDGLAGWADLSDHIVIWDYLVNFFGSGYLVPYPNLYAMSETIQYAAQFPAVKGYFGQHMQTIRSLQGGEFAELRTWVAAKMLWNPERDAEALIDEFVDGYYGAAAPYVKQYIQELHDALASSNTMLGSYMLVTAPYLTFDLMREADGLFAQAAAAVAQQPDLLMHVQKLRLSVDFVILMRRAEFMQEAAQRNMVWDFDLASRLQRFKQLTAGVQYYSANGLMQTVYDFLDIDLAAPPVPDLVAQQPGAEWRDFQEVDFRLFAGGGMTHDVKASNHAALTIPGNTNNWAIQLHNDVLPREGEWKLYASVRVDPGSGPAEATAFQLGVYPNPTVTKVTYGTVSDGEYHVIEVPGTYEYNPALVKQYLWFAPPNASTIQRMYVDRVFAVLQ